MLMGVQKLNRCPNPARLAVVTNRILFGKRRGKKKRKSILISSQVQFEAVNLNSGGSRYIEESPKFLATGELFSGKTHMRENTCKYAIFSIEIRKGKGEQYPLEH